MKKFSLPKISAWLATLAATSLVMLAPNMTHAARVPVVAKWGRHEIKLTSNVRYTNAIQQATINAVFTSPFGVEQVVPGFWDGGKTWRVRFSPDTPGRWIYRILCSDSTDTGLHGQAGEFICTAATGKGRFGKHGPLRVASDRRHLEHADYTPFFWVGDAAWDAGRLASPRDWQFFSTVRASQKFNAVQWALFPGKDFKGETAFTGREEISINLDFFKRLDEKINALNVNGLAAAIAPLWEIGAGADELLPESQAVALLRYAVARWGANDVAWILAFEGDPAGGQVARWKKIGRAVFGEITHAPVLLLPGETPWLLDEFRTEDWMDAFGCQTARVLDEDSLQWLLNGPLTLERRKSPPRPLITLAPPAENASASEAGKSLDAERTRRLLWWSAMLNTPAGVSYSAQGVARWDTNRAAKRAGERSDLPVWQNELFLPGARDIEALGDFFSAFEFWRLQPFARAIVNQPGMESPRRFIAAEGTESGDLLVAYVPESGDVTVASTAMPRAPQMAWVNTRNGKLVPATAVIGEKSFQFNTPDAGDWVLVIKGGK